MPSLFRAILKYRSRGNPYVYLLKIKIAQPYLFPSHLPETTAGKAAGMSKFSLERNNLLLVSESVWAQREHRHLTLYSRRESTFSPEASPSYILKHTHEIDLGQFPKLLYFSPCRTEFC